MYAKYIHPQWASESRSQYRLRLLRSLAADTGLPHAHFRVKQALRDVMEAPVTRNLGIFLPTQEQSRNAQKGRYICVAELQRPVSF
jgi:hypothetical protein